MTEAFKILPEEKQRAILDAAASEFAEHGYKEASTNRIVRAAGIGKGMLFYYFGSKLELYNDLIDQGSVLLAARGEELFASAENQDIIAAFQRATRMKMEMYLERPALLEFFTRLYLHPEEGAVSEESKRRLAEVMEQREAAMRQLYERADPSKLRQDIPKERLMNYLSWAMEGYTQHLTGVVRSSFAGRISDLDLEPYWAEFDVYMEDLKTMFYQT